MPENTIAYAIGDVHGCAGLLEEVMEWIVAHANGRPETRRIIVVLGDMIDRGPDPRGVIEYLLQGPPPGFEMVCLCGNHEDMMLEVMNHGTGLALWLGNGGGQTLASYSIENRRLLTATSAEMTRAILTAKVPRRHRRFFDNLGLSYRLGDYLFVHAGIRPGVDLEVQTSFDMMWIRREFTGSDADLGVHVVHGHSVTATPDERGNATGLDTGAVMTGKLSCLALWADQRETFVTLGW